MGGVGNQLFQYFAGLNLANSTNSEVELVISQLNKHKSHHEGSEITKFKPLEITNVQAKNTGRISSSLRRILFSLCLRVRVFPRIAALMGFISDPFLGKNDKVFSAKNYYLKGYFQTHRNFDSCTPQQRKLFLTYQSQWCESLSEEIAASNAVAIHIRRGDYIESSDSFGILTAGYYKQAINLLVERVENPSFYVFSDDVNAAKIILKELNLRDIAFIEPPAESSAVESLFLMGLCKGLIMANSTFSYWAALLGNEKEIVVYPKPWATSSKIIEPQFPHYWVNCESNLRN
jgi:hypothetical protein